MKKYEEEKYRLENIKEHIYPWVKAELSDTQALNGKHFSEKDAPVIGFLGDLNVVFAIKRDEDVYEILKENVGDAKKLIKELDDSKYIDVFSMMLNEDYQLSVGYQNRLKELKNDSSLFKFLFIKNCEYLHKYKEICVANDFI